MRKYKVTSHNPAYRNITISVVNLNLLPTNDTIYSNLREVVNEVNVSSAPNENNDASDSDDDGIMEGPVENDFDDNILESVVALDVRNNLEANLILETVIHNPIAPILDAIQQPIEWPPLHPLPLDEYNTPFLFSNAFPVLFPLVMVTLPIKLEIKLFL